MPRTSKKYFPKEFKDKIWNNFLNDIKKLKTGESLDKFLNKYLSPDEKNILEKRLGLFDLLKSGRGCRQISREIDITTNTIYFIKRNFKNPKKTKNRNKSERKSAEESFLHKKNSIMPTYTGKGRWKI